MFLVAVSTKLSSLDDITPSDSEQFVSDCLSDPLCEAYRQEVAVLGRCPVVAEAEMIRKWVADRKEGVAFALVASKGEKKRNRK